MGLAELATEVAARIQTVHLDGDHRSARRPDLAESELGQGTTLQVRFPRDARPAQEVAAATPPTASRA